MPSPGRRSRGGGGRGRGRGFDYPFNAETRTLLEQLNHRGARGDWEEIVDRAQDLLERDFAPLLQYTLEVDLEDSWVYIVKEKPPWTPFTLLSVVKQNDGSLTDQGFPSMIQVQAAALSAHLDSLSYGQNPGPARALQIVRLVHDMFSAAPRSFSSATQGPAPSISAQEAQEIRARGMNKAKILYQECVDIIQSAVAGDSETESAWDNNSTGFWNSGPNWEGNQGYDRGTFAQREAGPHAGNQMAPDRAYTPSNPISSSPRAPMWRPTIRSTGRGPPPSAGRGRGRGRGRSPTQQGGPGRGPPSVWSSAPSFLRPQTLETGAYSSGGVALTTDFSGSQGQSPPGFSRDPHFNGPPGLGQGFPSLPNAGAHTPGATMGGFPGQPPLSFVHPQIENNQGSYRPASMPVTGPSGSICPKQPAHPMPPLRGGRTRPMAGRGPMPGMLNPTQHNAFQSTGWEFGVDRPNGSIPQDFRAPVQAQSTRNAKMAEHPLYGSFQFDMEEIMVDGNQSTPSLSFPDGAPCGIVEAWKENTI